MSNYIDHIKEKIKNKIAVEEINIIDNSQAHRNHASFQEGQLHLTDSNGDILSLTGYSAVGQVRKTYG